MGQWDSAAVNYRHRKMGDMVVGCLHMHVSYQLGFNDVIYFFNLLYVQGKRVILTIGNLFTHIQKILLGGCPSKGKDEGPLIIFFSKKNF